jgi:hypothetical protein
VPYLAQLLAGYRSGLDYDPPESGEAVRAALVEEGDAYRRGLLLGLLANSLTQPDRSSSKIGEAIEPRRTVTEAIQKPRMPSYPRRLLREREFLLTPEDYPEQHVVHVPGLSRIWSSCRAPGISAEFTRVRPERGLLDGFLDWHRSTLLWKCAGLTGERLSLASVPPSSLSPLGIVRHMADMERAWFRIRFRGEPLPRLYDYEDAAFEHAGPDRAEADFAVFAEEYDLACRAVARASLDDEFTGDCDRILSLRWVYTHMIEEYARHNGHADLLRQRIDGATGS